MTITADENNDKKTGNLLIHTIANDIMNSIKIDGPKLSDFI